MLWAQAGVDLLQLPPDVFVLAPLVSFQSGQTGDQIKQVLAAIPSDVYVTRARKDLAPAHSVLDVFLYELNLYSISPVAMFDVARVWPSTTGVRYGVGGGLRFSLVNVNLTMGYSANLHRLDTEKAGAFVFKLDVTNVFR